MKPAAPAPADSATGLPGLRSWRAVYFWVVVVFAVCVGLLLALTKMYS
jgi:hypothetical protein